VAVVSVLDDKDAAAMLRALLPSCDALVCCTASHPRAVPAGELAGLAGELAPALRTEVVPEPRAAVARARELAGAGGAALVTGSLYLLADLRRPVGAARSTM
jgi:dihydrofolate synthase/folylpolyglutamate synthase